jgi:hypothetical protein
MAKVAHLGGAAPQAQWQNNLNVSLRKSDATKKKGHSGRRGGDKADISSFRTSNFRLVLQVMEKPVGERKMADGGERGYGIQIGYLVFILSVQDLAY